MLLLYLSEYEVYTLCVCLCTTNEGNEFYLYSLTWLCFIYKLSPHGTKQGNQAHDTDWSL